MDHIPEHYYHRPQWYRSRFLHARLTHDCVPKPHHSASHQTLPVNLRLNCTWRSSQTCHLRSLCATTRTGPRCIEASLTSCPKNYHKFIAPAIGASGVSCAIKTSTQPKRKGYIQERQHHQTTRSAIANPHSLPSTKSTALLAFSILATVPPTLPFNSSNSSVPLCHVP